MGRPRVRALAVHDALRLLDTFRAGAQAEVRQRIPGPVQTYVDGAPGRDWIPVEVDHHIPAAICDVLGDEAEAYFRWLLARHLQTPGFRPLLQSTQRLFGVNPGSFVRATPAGWSIAYRDFCEPRVVDRGPQFAVLQLERCAPEVFEHPAYVESWSGFFSGFYDLSDHPGRVQGQAIPEEKLVRFAFEW